MSRYARLLTEDHQQSEEPAAPPSPAAFSATGTTTTTMSGMLASLKESAANVGTSAREGLGKANDSVRSGLGLPGGGGGSGEEDSSVASRSESSGLVDEVSEYCPKLTFRQRVTGFAICFGCGYLMTFASFRLFVKLVEGNPAPFVFLYSSGNIMSLMSSMFLSGPSRQFKSMFDDKRRATSTAYLASLGCSIAVCFIPMPTGPKIGLLVLLLLVQMSASLWYTLSYIPYGRATARRMLSSFVAGEE